ncbi:MAG TPA: adenylate/guanylate cyclase domain-containing protein [Anaerolineales bacterium]|nr:adenylate/guanylate cyclase domain-containing protein [Anaerolineales bacterium]
MTILIVDDSPSQRLLLTSLLKSEGYTSVVAAQSAHEAFARLGMDGSLEPGDTELVLMDISMPDMNGIEACQRIKSRESLHDIPIIMVTASNEAGDLQAAFAAGAIDYITKPPNKVEMMARVRSALRLKKETDDRKARERELLRLTQQLAELNGQLQNTLAQLDEKHSQLQVEQDKSERLLLNILPKPVAERLKNESGTIADSFPEVTVLFADIVDFTRLSAHSPASDIVALLNDIFSKFDALAERHGLEKIKTIGDAYMVVGGVPTPRTDHVEAIANMALDMRELVTGRRRATGGLLQVRIGIHTGPVVAGVIGTSKFIYDLWGDTVNIASRMEAMGVANSIQVTAETHNRLRDHYTFEERGSVTVKGRGEMRTYLLTGKKE